MEDFSDQTVFLPSLSGFYGKLYHQSLISHKKIMLGCHFLNLWVLTIFEYCPLQKEII